MIIRGTSAEATRPMLLMPPRMTAPTSSMRVRPTTQVSISTMLVTCWVTVLAWVPLPIPNAAMAPKTAKAPPRTVPSQPFSPYLR